MLALWSARGKCWRWDRKRRGVLAKGSATWSTTSTVCLDKSTSAHSAGVFTKEESGREDSLDRNIMDLSNLKTGMDSQLWLHPGVYVSCTLNFRGPDPMHVKPWKLEMWYVRPVTTLQWVDCVFLWWTVPALWQLMNEPKSCSSHRSLIICSM